MKEFTPDMMIAQIDRALATGKCPLCKSALQVLDTPHYMELKCPGCVWCCTMGGIEE